METWFLMLVIPILPLMSIEKPIPNTPIYSNYNDCVDEIVRRIKTEPSNNYVCKKVVVKK